MVGQLGSWAEANLLSPSPCAQALQRLKYRPIYNAALTKRLLCQAYIIDCAQGGGRSEVNLQLSKGVAIEQRGRGMFKPSNLTTRQHFWAGMSSLTPPKAMLPSMSVACRPILSLGDWGWHHWIDSSSTARRMYCSAAPASVAAPLEVPPPLRHAIPRELCCACPDERAPCQG